MAATPRAPKQWSLTKNETVNSVENWRQNLIYGLSLDPICAPYLKSDVVWGKKTAQNPNRGFIDDVAPIPEARRKTAEQKVAALELMLGQIANYCVVISRSSIVKQSTSLDDIWQKIRQHYGFQSSGSHFLDLASIRLEPDERYEDLFQRLMAFFEDALLTRDSGLTHHGEVPQGDEDLSPTLENTIVFVWLQLINPGLPGLVKQRYGPELRNKTLASLKPEISQALSSLIDELRTIEDSRIMFSRAKVNTPSRSSNKSCVLCKTAGRPSGHFLSGCRFLPESDRKYIRAGKSRMVNEFRDEEYFSDEDEEVAPPISVRSDVDSAFLDPQPSVRRVDVIESPVLNCYYNKHTVKIVLDSGATTNMVKKSFASSIGLSIKPTSQKAYQADGITPLDVVGEVHCTLSRGDMTLFLDALVVVKLDTDVLGGGPFMFTNDIGTRPKLFQIIIAGSEIVHYGSSAEPRVSVRRAQAVLVRSPSKSTVVMPGDYVDLKMPPEADPDCVWALEPRLDSPLNKCLAETTWPSPQEIVAVGRTLRLTNDTKDLIRLKKSEHVCQIRPVVSVSDIPDTDVSTCPSVKPSDTRSLQSSAVSLDPDCQLDRDTRKQFFDVHSEFDSVFNPVVPKYNGTSGMIEGNVNMGSTKPPQRKGRLPSYNREMLIRLQQVCDDLEGYGVLAKPEEVGVQVENLNLTFMVNKPGGGHRLVTSFAEVGHYARPQPALMPNVDQVLRNIAGWKYIIKTDLRKSFYQIPLAHSSMKYCGIVTPFKGVRVYTRCAMGMPGSETALEELMNRVLGNFVMDGWCAKIADDLYVGGDSPQELLSHWISVLSQLKRNNLGLNAPKTVIAPKSTIILGWEWSGGTLKATSHKVSALSTVEPPTSVQGLRSFIGAYKVLSRVLRGYAMLLDPLEKLTAGKQSKDKIEWSESTRLDFTKAQDALCDCQTITTPVPNDQLWVVTDASVSPGGIAATLYVSRNGDLKLAGFFNAKLRSFQLKWLPCEVEALCIASAVDHFAPFIVQSKHQAQVLTDSKPCVQAHLKLLRGKFSSSARISTFLSTVSRYNMRISHIAGVANLPADYSSRQPIECFNQKCQICQFVDDMSDCTVRNVSVKDVIDGSVSMPFTSRNAWHTTQQECHDLRRAYAHLKNGTRPGKKAVNVRDVRRYLHDTVISNDGLLVVRDSKPFQPQRDRIVVPRSVLDGLITATHLRFSHPTAYQMKQLLTRYFYALDLDRSIQAACDSCHHCQSLKSIPTALQSQSSCEPPDVIGTNFAVDVMRRYRQFVLVMRETVSSYTLTCLVENERHETLRDAIVMLCAGVKPHGSGGATIRVDPGPGLVALKDDSCFKAHGIVLDIGRAKNPNKNPVAEKAIQELGRECLNLSPEGGPLRPVTLALVTANLNARIRNNGLSAREVWTQRDQVTGQQLPVEDAQIISKQHFDRVYNHDSKGRSQNRDHVNVAPGSQYTPHVGDLVYLIRDKDKTKCRDRYLVVDVNDTLCRVRKFTKNQFRSKSYDVNLTECYPVKSEMMAGGHNDLMRGLTDRDDDVKYDVYPVLGGEAEDGVSPISVMPPAEIVEPIVDHHDLADDSYLAQNPVEPVIEVNEDSDSMGYASGTPRRSTRTHKKPLWHDEYCME